MCTLIVSPVNCENWWKVDLERKFAFSVVALPLFLELNAQFLPDPRSSGAQTIVIQFDIGNKTWYAFTKTAINLFLLA